MRVGAVDRATLGEAAAKCTLPGLRLRIGLGKRVEHADTPDLIRLFSANAKRPRRRSAADQCDEIASSHYFPKICRSAPAFAQSYSISVSANRTGGVGASRPAGDDDAPETAPAAALTAPSM